MPKLQKANSDGVLNPLLISRKILMLSKRYESIEVDHRTWLYVLSGTLWSTSSDIHQVVEIQIETSTKMYTSF